MIPAPVPVAPIAIILVAVIGVFFYAAFLAGRGAGRSEPGTKPRKLGYSLAVAAVVLGLAGAALLVNILATHDRNYGFAVWSSLTQDYGLAPAAPGQGFKEGAPFPAILDGRDATCTVTLPRTVICDGKELAPAGT